MSEKTQHVRFLVFFFFKQLAKQIEAAVGQLLPSVVFFKIHLNVNRLWKIHFQTVNRDGYRRWIYILYI